MDQLPFDQTLIQRILPHRYPFLLVDRITEFEPDKRIVGIKNVSLTERCLTREPGQAPTLPPTILTEAVAQVGAIMILAKPENREKLIYFPTVTREDFEIFDNGVKQELVVFENQTADALAAMVIALLGLWVGFSRRFARKHDDILFYARSDRYYFAAPRVPATSQRLKGTASRPIGSTIC